MTIDDSLPGAEIVKQGLEDGLRRESTAEALALQAVASRLRPLGIDVVDIVKDPELALYARLQADDRVNAYGRYNSLLRRLDSFASALERRHRAER